VDLNLTNSSTSTSASIIIQPTQADHRSTSMVCRFALQSLVSLPGHKARDLMAGAYYMDNATLAVDAGRNMVRSLPFTPSIHDIRVRS
jgi:hypothetical protein